MSDNYLLNGDFATGNLSNWIGSGSIKSISTALWGHGEPTYFLEGSGSSSTVDVYQDIDLSNAAEGLTAKLTAYRASSAGSDTGEIILEALDISNVILDSITTGAEYISPDNRWFIRTLDLIIPINTIKLRIRCKNYLIAGGFSNAAFDTLRLRVGTFSAQLLDNPSFETGDFTGWTIVNGTPLIYTATNAQPNFAEGQYAATFTNGENGEISQTKAIPGGFSDGDQLLLRFFRADSFDDADSMNVIMEALDGSNTVLTSVETGIENLSPINKWFERYLKLIIPVGATQVRIRVLGIFASGTTVNSVVDGMELYAYIDSGNIIPSANVAITQLPVNVIDNSDAGVSITQLPILLITTPAQPAAITQLPILTSVINKSLPIPGNPVVPEVPLIEVWEWLTVSNKKAMGNEQRSGLLANPRITNKFNIIVDEAERKEFYKFLYYWINKEIIYPKYHFSAYLNQASLAATSKLYFNPAQTDLRPSEQIALFDPHLTETRYVMAASIDTDGATLAAPLEYDVPAHWLVCPAPAWRMGLPVGFAMGARAGEGSIALQTTQERPILRPGQTASPIIVDGMPVLDRLPHDGADELFNQNLVWLDNGTSFQSSIVNELTPKIEGKRTFTVPRRTDMDWWRKFGDLINGSRKPFLLPTHFDDLVLTIQPPLNATRITIDNIQYARYFKALNYRYVMLVTARGKKYRKVNDIVINYNLSGDPVSVDLILAVSIGNIAGDNVISKVSIVNKCRLEKDEFVFTHNGYDAKIDLAIKAVDR